MGKIRVKSFDETSSEDEVKLKAKKEAKRAQKMAEKNAKQEEVIEEITEASEPTKAVEETVAVEEVKEVKKAKKEKFAVANKKTESKRHKENLTQVSKTQEYNLDQAITALKKFKKSKFDETVELHVNVKEKGIHGQITLPHGTGKVMRIKIADEAIIAEVAKGKIDFDVLVATPQMMPQLAKVARVLGPRGLMPNPKNGTITDKPEEAVKKLAGGQINYKTESAAPIIHLSVGKLSFEDNKIKENVTVLLSSIGKDKVTSATIKSTMSPGIKLHVN